jgi:hypothetical protein
VEGTGLLFVLDLFNDAISSSDFVALYVRRLLNNELEGMWKEVVELI